VLKAALGFVPGAAGWMALANDDSVKQVARQSPWKDLEMAITTCIKCGRHAFVLASLPFGESRKLTMIQCSGCRTPVGTLDPTFGSQIARLRHEVAAIDDKLSWIARALRQ